MADTMQYVDFDLLEKFMVEVFVRVGVPREDAEICAEVLITSDKRGIDSHGVGRFKPIYIDRIRAGQILPVTEIERVRETKATAVFDAHNGMGQVASKKAMQTAIDKARECGIAMTVVRNSNHYGIAGYYALMAVAAGMIGITGTNARPSIAPTFGVENMLGTNPLTFGMPTDEDFPFVLDCATSVSQRGKIEAYARLGKATPPGWVIGRDGSARTDTEQILEDLVKGQAALVPLGGMGEETAGYKGYGYATVVEILSAALSGGPFLRALTGLDAAGAKIPYGLGHFFIAVDIAAFIDLGEFKSISGRILRDLRGSAKMPGQARIYTAGEKEHLAWLERRGRGAGVDARLQEQILSLKKDFGLADFVFPFE
jgi:L-2-hydroxycarboxylate dehydrogenase (NAD+)